VLGVQPYEERLMSEYDVLVVGAGSAGAVLASRLSEDPARRVAVLEAGPVYDSFDKFPSSLLDPSDMSNAVPGSPHNWSMTGQMRPGVQRPIARGKVVGGSSSINGAYFVRGTPANFDDWVKLGNDMWSYDQVLPYYRRSETDLDYSNDLHGDRGPIKVRREPADRAPEFTPAFTAACQSLGFEEEPDKNGAGSGGVGPVPLNIHDGVRQSTAITYLLPAMARPNLDVIGNAHVLKVILEGTKCVGVEAEVDGDRRMFRSNEVVISAGALRSPQLLMLSGIGPADHLRSVGIDVLVDLPGVGRNLEDHFELSVKWEFSGSTPPMPGRGVMTTVLNWRSSLAGATDDLEILPFVATSADQMRVGSMAKRPFKTLAAMRHTSPRFLIAQARAMRRPFFVIGLQQPDSSGSVTLSSADPHALPVLDWDVLSKDTDVARVREAVRTTNEVFKAADMRRIGARAVGLEDRDVNSDAAVDEWIRAHLFAVGHPSCTCRMGPQSDLTSVVGQGGEVHGVEGLRVVDTSIFPKITSRGPNATAVMVAERISDTMVTPSR
jgi:choline dehydrogenase